MNLFWAAVRNVTAPRQFESPHRFKTLALCAKIAACFCKCEVNSTGAPLESFPLREIGHEGISNNVRDAYGSRDQRGLRNGADVQIGGGVRVGDAFQAIVASKLIAIWGRWFCVEISQVGHRASLALNKRDTYSQAAIARRRSISGRVSGRVMTSGLNDAAAKRLNDFLCSVAID